MKINKVKGFQFSNHFLMSLHAPKSVVFVCLRYPVGKSAQGSNPKVTDEYSINLLLEFSKTKGRKKDGGYVNVPSSLQHLQLQSEALHTKAFVESLLGLFLGIQYQKYTNVIPKWAENAKRTYELSCVKHMSSDKIAITIDSTIQNWAPSNWENLAKHSICN